MSLPASREPTSTPRPALRPLARTLPHFPGERSQGKWRQGQAHTPGRCPSVLAGGTRGSGC